MPIPPEPLSIANMSGDYYYCNNTYYTAVCQHYTFPLCFTTSRLTEKLQGKIRTIEPDGVFGNDPSGLAIAHDLSGGSRLETRLKGTHAEGHEGHEYFLHSPLLLRAAKVQIPSDRVFHSSCRLLHLSVSLNYRGGNLFVVLFLSF